MRASCRRLLAATQASCSTITSTSRIVTGIQPTGTPHIGNYLGFISNFLRLQNGTSCAKFLFLADYHAISVGLPNRDKLRHDIRAAATSLLACGIDPNQTLLFQQSLVPEHTELAWILGALQTMARLQRLPQYKEKSKKYADANSPLGLLSYPVLQAADVLLYRATHVPVGDDQKQHFNLLTELAAKFNRSVDVDFFADIHMLLSPTPRIRSLRDPTKKMSKSDESRWSTIFITDTAEVVAAKVRKAVTDSAGVRVTYEPTRRPGLANLIDILAALRAQPIEQVATECSTLGTVELKTLCVDAINEALEPIRQRHAVFSSRPELVDEMLTAHSEQARDEARKTMVKVKEAVGFC